MKRRGIEHRRGFATADAMVAMLVLALTIGLALHTSSVGRKIALRAAEVRETNLLAEQLLAKPIAPDQVLEGFVGSLAWRLESRALDPKVTDQSAPRLCRREAVIRAKSGAVYRDGLTLLCEEPGHGPA